MIFEQIATGGCQSYLLGCSDTCAAVVIDPEISQLDRYLGLAARDGLRIRYLIDTHTHAAQLFRDTATRAAARRARGDASRESGAVRGHALGRRRHDSRRPPAGPA